MADGETCYAVGERDGETLMCTLPAGHRTLLEHYDGNRGLRWLQDDRGNVSAWPGTEADTLAFAARIYAIGGDRDG